MPVLIYFGFPFYAIAGFGPKPHFCLGGESPNWTFKVLDSTNPERLSVNKINSATTYDTFRDGGPKPGTMLTKSTILEDTVSLFIILQILMVLFEITYDISS